MSQSVAWACAFDGQRLALLSDCAIPGWERIFYLVGIDCER